MGWYDERVLPHLINLACAAKPSSKQREKIVPHAEGDVLEIGFGSGLNLPYYNKDKVRKVFGLEPSAGMRKLAGGRITEAPVEVELIDLPGEQIPLDDNSVDTVLMTYTLCTIPDVIEALDGMRRVLKPGGKLLFCEHGKAPDESVLRWQNRLNPAWGKIGGGCNINRDIPALIGQGGFRITSDERMYIPGPRIFCYNYWGIAEAS
jgi:ubiquinone/menaquinone biosynthesis C-methylase UbiE